MKLLTRLAVAAVLLASASSASAQALSEAQAQAAIAQQKATYNKAFTACMEGKGYTVK